MGMTLGLWVFPHVGSVGFCGVSVGFLWVSVGFLGACLISGTGRNHQVPNFRDGMSQNA